MTDASVQVVGAVLGLTFPDWYTFGTALVVGIALGCIYALIAISFNLVLAACGVFNLTISAVITATVILSYLLGTKSGLHPLVVVPLVIAFGGVVGYAAELIAVRRVVAIRPKDVAHDTMVSTLGLGMAINALVAILFGTNIYPIDSYVSPNPIVVSSIPIRPAYIVTTVVVLGVAIGLELMLRYTEYGVVTRAVIASNEGASLVGISVQRVVQASFIASGMMAGLAGFLIGPVVSASAWVGEEVMLYGFAAIAIGGFASFRGAVFGGLIVGLVVGLLPTMFHPSWRGPIVFLTVVIVLFIKPTGLFGRSGQFGAASVREV